MINVQCTKQEVVRGVGELGALIAEYAVTFRNKGLMVTVENLYDGTYGATFTWKDSV